MREKAEPHKTAEAKRSHGSRSFFSMRQVHTISTPTLDDIERNWVRLSTSSGARRV